MKPIPNSPTELSVLRFDLYETLTEVRQTYFPSLADWKIEVWFHPQPTLAYIIVEKKAARICFHAVLNHEQTPRPVIVYILCHELTHILVRPREVEGKMKTHPPEFWEAERELLNSDNRALARAWITMALGLHLRKNEKKECIDVKKSWKRTRERSLLSWSYVLQMASSNKPETEDKCCL